MNESKFKSLPWIDSISINGFINGKKFKKNLNEVSWLEMFVRRSSEAISIHHCTRVLRRHLHGLPSRDDCCVYAASVLDIWSFNIRFWKFPLYLEFFPWHFRTFFTVIYSDETSEIIEVESDTIFFTREKNRFGFVIGHTIFFTCGENRMNRICKSQYSYNKLSFIRPLW